MIIGHLWQASGRRRIEAALALALARVALGVLPFRVVMWGLGLRMDADTMGSEVQAAGEARAVGQAVARAARKVPFRAVCLQQALAASMMLRRRNLAVRVYFGMARTAEGATLAHAWCLCGETAVTGMGEAGNFTPVMVYGG